MRALLKVSRNPNRKGENYAYHANPNIPDRRGRIALAGESFHPDAVNHQVDLECCRRHRRRVVAFGRVWALSQPLAHPRWHLNKQW